MYVEPKIEALSRNHFCHEKSKSIKYHVCVPSLSYPAYKAHAPCHIVCGLPSCATLIYIIS